jgi:hypothetical protein
MEQHETRTETKEMRFWRSFAGYTYCIRPPNKEINEETNIYRI